MATYLDSRQGEFASGSSLPSSLRFTASRFAFYVAIGVAAVSATGITLARINVPIGAANGSGGRVQASAISPAAGISLTANANSAPVMHPAVVAPVAANPGRSHAAFRRSRIALSAQARSTEIPDAVKPAIFQLNGKEFLVAQMVSIPVAEPARPKVTSATAAAPTTALGPALSSLNDSAKSANLYTEGDLTVADFDAITGTLQVSDGRTFVLGTTVAASNAAPWVAYRSGVHFRCDQSGSCVLMRAGALAPNAKLI